MSKTLPLRILAVDDDHHALGSIRELLKSIPGTELVGTASSLTETMDQLEAALPDLVLLDVELPDGSGFELARTLKNRLPNCGIVFITAFDHYAVQALRHSALDFLLKPVSILELNQAIQRSREMKLGFDFKEKLEELRQYLLTGRKLKFVTKSGFFLVEPDEVLYCEAAGSYSELHLLNQQTEMVSMGLGRLESYLNPHGFFRISRAHIINLSHLVRLNKKERTVGLNQLSASKKESLELHISHDRIQDLEDRLLM